MRGRSAGGGSITKSLENCALPQFRCAILILLPSSIMRTTSSSEEILHTLIHDLRQPLSNISTSVFYLDVVLDYPTGRAGEQMRFLERQVAQAARLLEIASAELRAQRKGAGAAESLDLTNSVTAALT
jgi:hypothetical protein